MEPNTEQTENTKVEKIPTAKVKARPKYRQPTFTIVIAEMGMGKSYNTRKIGKRYLLGDKSTKTEPRKVIYFDINNEYKDIKTIPVDYAFDILLPAEERKNYPNWILAFSDKRFPVEERRVVPIKEDGYPMTIDEVNIVLEYILKFFFGGLLVVEDPTKYIADTVDRDLSGGLASIRHRNCDVICHFQYKTKALHPKLWGVKTYVRLHRTADYFKKYKQRIAGQETILYLAECLVDYMNDNLRKNATEEDIELQFEIPIEKFFCWIDFKTNKIRGLFTKDDFQEAILAYISENRKDALDKLLLQFNPEDGKPIYTFKQAYEIRKAQLMEQYYGNPK